MQVKLREVVHSQTRNLVVYGVTIPKDIAVFFKGVFFNIEKSGCSVILTSGTCIIPTKEDIKNFNLEEVRI